MRWFIAGWLMLLLLVGVAYAQGRDTVTLPNGEQVTVEQDLNRTIITLSNGVQVTRTQMVDNASGWGAPSTQQRRPGQGEPARKPAARISVSNTPGAQRQACLW